MIETVDREGEGEQCEEQIVQGYEHEIEGAAGLAEHAADELARNQQTVAFS